MKLGEAQSHFERGLVVSSGVMIASLSATDRLTYPFGTRHREGVMCVLSTERAMFNCRPPNSSIGPTQEAP